MIKKNEIYTVDVTDISNMGYGICRVDGVVTFINGGVDGDKCEIRIIKVNKDYYIAKVEKLIKKSPYRIDSSCNVSVRCGGCIYQSITYEHELELKKNYISHALHKVGLADITVNDVLSTGEIDGYRNKVQYPVGDNNVIGYYAPHSHNIVECINCRLQSRVFDTLMADIRSFLHKYKVDCVRHIYLRHGKGTGEVMVCLVIDKDNFKFDNEFIEYITSKHDNVVSIMLNYNKADTNVILGDVFVNIYGVDYISDTLNDVKFHISAPSFYQVNHDSSELLYKLTGDGVGFRDGDRVLDLYCGTGTIGLYIASRFNIKLTGIEIIPDAVDYAKLNAELNGIGDTQFICGDVNELDNIEHNDVIIIDPPRKGCTPELIKQICDAEPRTVAYVSCNPDTLARDLVKFSEYGYATDKVTPVDMFPRTGHVESIALLSKLNTKQHIEIDIHMDELDLTGAEKKATYEEIKEYVLEHTGLKVSNLYIAQVKQKCGIIERENYNKPKSEDPKQPQCPPDKEAAIVDALKHFGM